MQFQYPLMGGIGIVAVFVAMFASQQMMVSPDENDIIETSDKSNTISQKQDLFANTDQIREEIQVTNGAKHLDS